MTDITATTEGARLLGATRATWRRWGPYVSDRQWGTVREDYSPGGTAWDYFPHDHARSRAYRWGEDAIAGWSDKDCLLCLGLACWNGNDAILKERLFGLSNSEGNHAEDVKELYFHLDGVPSHAYMRMLYRYPHAAFPYTALVEENARRGVHDPEYELLDTGALAENRYFDIVVEYAKEDAETTVMRVTAHNCGPDPAALHLLPQLTARNVWTWTAAKPPSFVCNDTGVAITHDAFPPMHLTAQAEAGEVQLIFCNNETNTQRLYNVPNASLVKDGIGARVLHADTTAVSAHTGTRVAAWWQGTLAPGATVTITLRLGPTEASTDTQALFVLRRNEANQFYACLQEQITDADRRLIQRQALAGLLWSKQFYCYDVYRWLRGDAAEPPPPEGRWGGRNNDWQHLNNEHIISMPDKWEYPWYASWDLAFQSVSFALIDPDFAKNQLLLLLRDRYMHPSGQIPAYEWAFADSNPPLHAWASWRVYEMDKALTGVPDYEFLREVFNKLLLNFGWWVNRKDAHGRNIFQGGFLGLDNIEIFNRSTELPTGGTLDQPDGTGWMGSFALNMLRIALELAMADAAYQDIAIKFFEHFLYIAKALGDAAHGTGLWDEQDQFFYDRLCLPDGTSVPLRVRSAVGLIPIFAVQVLEPELLEEMPGFQAGMQWFLTHRKDLASLVSFVDEPGHGERRLVSLLRTHRLTKLLERLLEESEFLSPHGLRAVSRFHADHPYVYNFKGTDFTMHYEPAESANRDFGGNSNWRGPVWMPINYRIVESLYEFARYFGDSFRVTFPVGSQQTITLKETAELISERLISLFLKDEHGERPVMRTYPGLQPGPDNEDLILFHEYFHGDTGRGVGASHQTGWTALVALLIQPRAESSSANVPMKAKQ